MLGIPIDEVRRATAQRGIVLALVAAVALIVLPGCRRDADDTVGFRLVTNWSGMVIEQLDFKIVDINETEVSGLERRPPQVAKQLESGVDVYVYLPKAKVRTKVVCHVWGVVDDTYVSYGKATFEVVSGSIPDVNVTLMPGGTKSRGDACQGNLDCNTGFCVAGVCCDGACTDTCMTCNAPGKRGTCSPVPAGVQDKQCQKEDPQLCGFDGTCDGKGACRKYPRGSRCADGMCNGSAIVAGSTCDGEGKCIPGEERICAPFMCETANGVPRCRSTCTSSADCIAGRACEEGSCGKRISGSSCTLGVECESGFCVEGICCDSSCEGACVSCKQTGSLGTCTPVQKGSPDPRSLCPDQGATTCGYDGTCDGEGACAYYGRDTICSAPACKSSTVLGTAGKCSGAGKCELGGEISCDPFVCDAGACKSSCASDNDCAPMTVCDVRLRSCGKRGNGQTCNAPIDCVSGNCVDGVCCNEACSGRCRSCTAGKVPGVCSFIAAGEPDPMCTVSPVSSCDWDGKCDGAGGCRNYPSGTECQAASCNGNSRVLVSKCDGAGSCRGTGTVNCGAYACNNGTCYSGCASNSHCVSPNTCNGGICSLRGNGGPCSASTQCMSPLVCIAGQCQLKPQGTSCSSASECATGFCTEGVCCEASSCGTCKSCKVSGSLGACAPLAAGVRDVRCTIDPVASCDRDGTCDGAGACRMYVTGTVCGNASCLDRTTLSGRKTCDGQGTCRDGGTQNCAPYACNAGACYTTCTDNNQCAMTNGNRCRNGACNQ